MSNQEKEQSPLSPTTTRASSSRTRTPTPMPQQRRDDQADKDVAARSNLLSDDPELIKRENDNRGLIEQHRMTFVRATWRTLHIHYTHFALAWKRHLIKKKRYKQHDIDLVHLLENATEVKIQGHNELKNFIGDPNVYVRRSIRKQSLAVAVCYYLKWYLPKGINKSFSCFQNIHPKNISNAREIFKNFQPNKKEAYNDWVEAGNDLCTILKLEQIKGVQKFVDETYPQRVEVTEEETQDFLDSFKSLLQLYRLQLSQRPVIKRTKKRTAAVDSADDCTKYTSKLCFDVPDEDFHLAQMHELLDIVQNLPKIKEHQRALVKINIAQTILADLKQAIQLKCDVKDEKSDGPTSQKRSCGRKDNVGIEKKEVKDWEDDKHEEDDEEYSEDEAALPRRLKGTKYQARQANAAASEKHNVMVSTDKRDDRTCQASRKKSFYRTDKINVSDTSSNCIEQQKNNRGKSDGEFIDKHLKTSETTASPRTDRKRVWQNNGDKKPDDQQVGIEAAQMNMNKMNDDGGDGCDSKIPKLQSLKTAVSGDNSLPRRARRIRKKLRRLLILSQPIQQRRIEVGLLNHL